MAAFIGMRLGSLGIKKYLEKPGMAPSARKRTEVGAPPLHSLNVVTIKPETSQDLDKNIPIISKTKMTNKIRVGKIPDQARLAIHEPNTTTLKKILRLERGIKLDPDTDRVMVFSRGYIPVAKPRWGTPRQGGGLHWIYRLAENNILEHTTCITFDYDDDASQANFGQDYDVACLEAIIDIVNKKAPKARILLMGDCRGAHVILRYLALADNPLIDTCILECPYSSVKELRKKVAESYVVPYMGSIGYDFFNNFFDWYYPNFHQMKDNLIHLLSNVRNKKIFIGYHMNDQVISPKNVAPLVNALKTHNELYFYKSVNALGEHSRMSRIPEYQETINSFLRNCDIPHNPSLAQAGEMALAQSYECVNNSCDSYLTA